MLSNASYAFKVAQETIRSTLLQNEKKGRERLLFGVKKSGMIFFSEIIRPQTPLVFFDLLRRVFRAKKNMCLVKNGTMAYSTDHDFEGV